MTPFRRDGFRGVLICAALAVPAVVWPSANSARAAAPEHADLAERLLQTGVQLERVSPAAAAALGDAAGQMFDNDPRLLRLAADLRIDLGQRDLAIKLLSALRQLQPDDQLAQVQSIDLIVSRMETADAKADYLTRVVDNAAVPAEVRSHAALLLSGVQSQRGLDEAAMAAVDQSLHLNPLNPRALQIHLDSAMRSGTAPQRARALVDLLLANPLQPAVLSRLAEENARAGAADVAIDLYRRLFAQLATSQSPPTTDDAINYTVLLVQAGRAKDAGPVVDAVTKNDPFSAPVQYLGVLMAQQSGDAAGAAAQVEIARAALTKNLIALQASFNKNTAKPEEGGKEGGKAVLPDIKAAAALLQSLKKPELTQAYVNDLAAIAWLDVYFLGRPADGAVAAAIDQLADPKGAVPNRIDGFAALAAGDFDAANVKLSAVAPRDPLSQIGMLSLRLKQGQDKAAIAADAAKLLAQYPVDVWSLMIRQSTAAAGPLKYRSGEADAVVAESNRLPRPWLEFGKTPSDNYLLDVDALQPSITIGQPLLARVTLQNIGDRPLLIGPGGVIDQNVPIDMNMRSLTEEPFPGAAVARLTGRIVLQPNQSTSTVVRLDSTAIDTYIATNPQYGLSIFVSAVVNPVLRNNVVVPGVGGTRAQAKNVIDRTPTALTQLEVRHQFDKSLASADAVVRLHAVVQLIAAAEQLLGTNDPQRQAAVDAIAQVRKIAQSDPSSTVRATARQQLALHENDAGMATAVKAMLASTDVESRLIGCVMTINRSAAERAAWLAPLASDADPSVKRLAAAIARLPEAPTSQPTTLPTTK